MLTDTEKENIVLGFLKERAIPFRFCRHEAAATMEICERLKDRIGAAYCKNIFLQNRQGTRFYLVCLREDKKFVTAEVSKKLGVSRLSFGSAEALEQRLGCAAGAVSPLGLLFDRENRVRFVIDRDLCGRKMFAAHPCVNTAAVVMETEDFFTFLRCAGKDWKILEITGRGDADKISDIPGD